MFSPCLWRNVADEMSPRKKVIKVSTCSWERIASDDIWRERMAEELQNRISTLGDNRKRYSRICRHTHEYNNWGQHLFSRFCNVRFGLYKVKASETNDPFDKHLVSSFSHDFYRQGLSKNVADVPARQYFRVLYSSVCQITQPECLKQMTVSSLARFLVSLYLTFFIPCAILPKGKSLIKVCLEDATAIAITGAPGLRRMRVLDDFKHHHPSRYSCSLPVGEAAFIQAMMLWTAIVLEGCRDPIAVTEFANYISTNVLPTVSREDTVGDLFPSQTETKTLKNCKTAIYNNTFSVSGKSTTPYYRVVLEPETDVLRAVAEHTIVLQNKRKVSPFLLNDWTFMSIDMKPDSDILNNVFKKPDNSGKQRSRQPTIPSLQPSRRSKPFDVVLPTTRTRSTSPLQQFVLKKKLPSMTYKAAAITAALVNCVIQVIIITDSEQRVAGWLFSDWPDPTTNPLAAAICRNVSISDLSVIRYSFRDQSCAAAAVASLAVVALIPPLPFPAPPLSYRRVSSRQPR